MGPQPFGCGRVLPEPCLRRLRTCFNGAATFRLRKGELWSRKTSKVPRFNGAATFRLRKGVVGVADFYTAMGFNGAATFRLRKAEWVGAASARHAASMGPQPFGCGRERDLVIERRDLELQWGRNLSVAEGGGQGRPLGHVSFASMGPQPFGCGRRAISLSSIRKDIASMGPQPFGCGRCKLRQTRRLRLCCFNGAATFRLRKAACEFPVSSLNRSFNGAATFRLRKAERAK